MLAEHRLERVVQFADRVIVVPGDAQPLVIGTPAEVMKLAPIAPPVVELGRLAGWSPLPLTVRDARRAAGPIRDLLVGRPLARSDSQESQWQKGFGQPSADPVPSRWILMKRCPDDSRARTLVLHRRPPCARRVAGR